MAAGRAEKSDVPDLRVMTLSVRPSAQPGGQPGAENQPFQRAAAAAGLPGLFPCLASCLPDRRVQPGATPFRELPATLKFELSVTPAVLAPGMASVGREAPDACPRSSRSLTPGQGTNCFGNESRHLFACLF